jgi:hypothetical protein
MQRQRIHRKEKEIVHLNLKLDKVKSFNPHYTGPHSVRKLELLAKKRDPELECRNHQFGKKSPYSIDLQNQGAAAQEN